MTTMTAYLAERSTRPGAALFCSPHGQPLSRDAQPASTDAWAFQKPNAYRNAGCGVHAIRR